MISQPLDGNAFGYLGGSDAKIVRFVDGDPLAGVDKDALNNKFRPGNAGQWNAVATVAALAAIPVSAYGFQDPAGTTVLPDLVGSKPLTIAGVPSFQVAIAGAATFGIGGSAANTNQSASNSTVANINTTDVAFLVYMLTQAPTVGHQRIFHGASAGNAIEGIAGNSLIRLRNGGSQGNGVLTHGGVLRPYFVLCRKGVINALWTDIEERTITDNAAMAGSTFLTQFRISTNISTSTVFNYAARWEGPGAAGFFDTDLAGTRLKVKALLQTLNWTVSGY